MVSKQYIMYNVTTNRIKVGYYIHKCYYYGPIMTRNTMCLPLEPCVLSLNAVFTWLFS